MALKGAIAAHVEGVIKRIEVAAGDFWVAPVRVVVDVHAKLRPRCGGDDVAMSLVIRLDLPTGVQLLVTSDFGDERERIVTRGVAHGH
jgi:hypothetical protein